MKVIKGLFLGLLACLALAGCRTVRTVPVETVRTDSVYIDRLARDSVYVRDSVLVNRWRSGDTVFITKTATRHLYRDRIRTDTVAVVREHKTEIPVEAERQPTWWEQARLKAFWPLALAVAALSFITVWLARRMRKK